MGQCAVIRCPNESSGGFAYMTSPRQSVSICAEHHAAIGMGEPWLVEAGRQEGLLMGDDLPLIVTDSGFTRGHTTNLGPAVKLVLEAQDGSTRDFFVTHEALLDLAFQIADAIPPMD